MTGSGDDVLTDDHVLEYTYSRSVGPVLGGFLTGLRDGVILGSTGSNGAVIVPPTEYDPDTSESVGPLVEVGPEGELVTWSWVDHPAPDHPLDRPFAWALVRLDGATTAMLHVVDVPSADHVHSGMRVVAEFLPADERIGRVADIRAFVPVGEPS